MADDYQASLREVLYQLPMVVPPRPWIAKGIFSIGGLTEVGYVSGTDFLLVVSSQGRGLFDCLAGEKIARDPEDTWDGLNQTLLISPGIGPYAQSTIRLAGLHGGGLPRTTHDGWGMQYIPLPWPCHFIYLTLPWKRDSFDEWIKIATDGACEFRACGFSETGRSFVIATSCDLTIYSRELP